MSKKLHVGGGLLVLGTAGLAFAGVGTTISMPSTLSLQKIINAKHAGWVAHDNWMTQLPQDQIKRMMGVQHAPSLDAEFRVKEGSDRLLKTRLPSSIDWRNKDGVNWVDPIMNQGNCGSCVAFSTVGTLQTQLNISSGIPGLDEQFSTQALFSCGGGACDFGWEPQLAAQYLQTTGVPDEACSPQTEAATGVDVDCSTICPDHAARSYKIVGFTTPTSGTVDLDALKAALQNGPLETTLTVYYDFLFYQSGVYKHVSGSEAGGHAVSIVGYNDNGRYFIIRNSWGPDWGENGFVRVSYDDISGIGAETWQYQLPSPAGYVSLTTPTNRTFLAGTSHLTANSTFPGTTSIDVNISDASSRTVYTTTCSGANLTASSAGQNCAATMDTTTLKDGEYDAVAVAHVGSQTQTSQHEIFFIVNSTPTMPLAVANVTDDNGNAVDVTKPVSDRIVFNLATNSSPVPYTNITFHVVQNGKEILSKMAETVTQSGMTLGWRTVTVPNGVYDTYFTGQIAPLGKTPYTTESKHMTITVQNAPQN